MKLKIIVNSETGKWTVSIGCEHVIPPIIVRTIVTGKNAKVLQNQQCLAYLNQLNMCKPQKMFCQKWRNYYWSVFLVGKVKNVNSTLITQVVKTIIDNFKVNVYWLLFTQKMSLVLKFKTSWNKILS